MRVNYLLLFLFTTMYSINVQAQEKKKVDLGNIQGNFDINSQYYMKDEKINAEEFPEKIGANAYLNLIYNKNNFEAGIRYETYQPRLLGFSDKFEGSGMPFRYAKYNFQNGFEITAGNFYEQFGNGQVFRAYFEPGLGADNSVDGVRVRYTTKGVFIKAFAGQQRFYFEKGPGRVRGLDGEFFLNDLVPGFEKSKTKVKVGGSMVSKYQKDENTQFTLPENTLAYSGRFSLNHGKWSVSGEYTEKYSDPSAQNAFSFRNGRALSANLGYSKKGLGINLGAHTIDNMFFRSDRNNGSIFPELDINFVPALTKQYTYNLMSTLYPYATQPNGEFVGQADIIFKIPRGTVLGGKYGTSVQINSSFSHSIKQDTLSDPTAPIDSVYKIDPNRDILKTDLFAFGDEKYWWDLNIELARKFSKSFKMKFVYQYLEFNRYVIQGKTVENTNHNILYANTFVLDGLYKFNRKHSLRVEAQGMFLNNEYDQGNWATVVLEYSYSPHWFVSFMNQYNYGNRDKDKRIHYPFGSIGYIHGATRVTASYGRQREGVFCVGGVCRTVPASNGVTLSISSTF